jgi:hypothetical protein
MVITSFNFTLCISSLLYEVEDMVRLTNEAVSRVSAASPIRSDNRVFLDFSNDTENVAFEDVWPMVVAWSTRHVDALVSVEDAMFTLWCTIYADTEFVGLALKSEYIYVLGSRKIDLVISIYTQSIGDTMYVVAPENSPNPCP